jgi:hypothetical protein
MNTLRNSVFICRSKVPARNGGSKLRAGSYQRRMRTRRCYFLARLDRPFICKRHTVHLFARQLPWRDSLRYVADKGTKGLRRSRALWSQALRFCPKSGRLRFSKLIDQAIEADWRQWDNRGQGKAAGVFNGLPRNTRKEPQAL